MSVEDARELPVAGYAAPHGVPLDRIGRVVESEGFDDPGGWKRIEPEDLSRATVERRRRIEDEALHHPLRRAADDEPARDATPPIHQLLQHRRVLWRLAYEARELVQDQYRVLRRRAEEAIEELHPPRIRRVADSRDQARHLAREVCALEARLAIVAHVEDVRLADRRAQQARLPDPPTTVDDDEAGAAARCERPPQAANLVVTVEER